MDENERSQQRKALVARWESTRLLTGIKDDFGKEQVAVLLQNQIDDNSRYGEARTECHDPRAHGKYAQFMRISVPIVRRVFNPASFLPFKLVSVQAIRMVEDNYFYRDAYGLLKPRMISAKGRALREKVVVEPKPKEGELVSEYNLDREAEMVAEMSERIAGELSAEVVRDLKKNAGVKNIHAWKDAEVLKTGVGLVAGQIFRRTNKNPNWIVTSADMASELLGERKTAGEHPQYAGILNEKYVVYTYGRMEQGEVLLGHKSDDYTAGYFYCPMTPVFWMPGGADASPETEYYYMTRYGKAMPFPYFYGHITVTGYTKKEAE